MHPIAHFGECVHFVSLLWLQTHRAVETEDVLLVYIGGYTGYRLSEIVRFRALAALSRGVDS